MDFLKSVLIGAVFLGVMFGIAVGIITAISFWPMYIGGSLLILFGVIICWIFGGIARELM